MEPGKAFYTDAVKDEITVFDLKEPTTLAEFLTLDNLRSLGWEHDQLRVYVLDQAPMTLPVRDHYDLDFFVRWDELKDYYRGVYDIGIIEYFHFSGFLIHTVEFEVEHPVFNVALFPVESSPA